VKLVQVHHILNKRVTSRQNKPKYFHFSNHTNPPPLVTVFSFKWTKSALNFILFYKCSTNSWFYCHIIKFVWQCTKYYYSLELTSHKTFPNKVEKTLLPLHSFKSIAKTDCKKPKRFMLCHNIIHLSQSVRYRARLSNFIHLSQWSNNKARQTPKGSSIG
jgi:hypothetical protein